MIEKVDDLDSFLEEKTVAEKRFLMFKLFEDLIDEIVEDELKTEELLEFLEENHGYTYKLSQDFLNSSSTLEKKRTLGKMIEYLN